jgi:hypothetical protein
LRRSLSLNAPKYDLATQRNLKYRVYCARQVPRKPFLRGEKGKA